MANENIKIIVQEVDETRAKGSGASSDIVYVPGLAHQLTGYEYTNKPILCSDVDEFESYFGTEPYKLTETDVEQCSNYVTMNVGDYDKSYIYAKELLNAGLSVLYEAVCPEENSLENVATFETVENEKGFEGVFEKLHGLSNIFTIKALEEKTGKIKFRLTNMSRYGDVTLLLRSNSSVELTKVTLPTPTLSKMTASEITDNNKCVISWTDTEVNNLEIVLDIRASGTGDFSLCLVHGTDLTSSVISGDTPLLHFYKTYGDRLDNLKDKNEYTVKYITNGGYPSFVLIDNDRPIAVKMLDCAASRNDAVALIDHKDDRGKTLFGDDSIYEDVNDFFVNAANTEFGAMFTPWGEYSCATLNQSTLQSMPASFGYLLCLAKAIKTSPNWLAMAGVTRGIVPGLQRLKTDKVLSNVIAENYQPKYGDLGQSNVVSINAITNVKPYGLTIWGNRTLKPVSVDGTVATNFLNIRNMMSDIKKLAYNTAKSLMFEQDSDTLWLRFKSGVSPLLEQLKSGNGIVDYKIIKSDKKHNGNALTRGEMAAVIKIFPLYPVEYFEITVVVSDNDVAVS